MNDRRRQWRLGMVWALVLPCVIACAADSPQSGIPDADAEPGGGSDLGRARDASQPTADAMACVRRVLEAEVTNARDVGGHLLTAGKQISCRKLLRGGDLGDLSGDGCTEFAELGVRSVIDLRQSSVQTSDPPPACVLNAAKHVPAPMPKLLPDTPANYLALMDEDAAILAVFEALGDATSYPAYVHCVIGRDRASFVTGLVLLAAGASREAILAEFDLSVAAGVAVKRDCMVAVLDEVEQRGGIESYLSSVGVTGEQLAVLRAQLAK